MHENEGTRKMKKNNRKKSAGNLQVPNFLELIVGGWPSPDEIREDIAPLRALNEWDMLALGSRNFFGPIKGLDVVRGPNEAYKGLIVCVDYDNLRFIDDGGEDSDLSLDDRTIVLDGTVYIMNAITKTPSSESISRGVRDRLAEVVSIAKRGARSENEMVYFTHYGHGKVLESFHQFDTPVKEILNNSVGRMSSGMKHFLKKGSIATAEEIIEYCGWVAGDIGVDLTRLVALLDNVRLSEENGRDLGIALQLTNIQKNRNTDEKLGRMNYCPSEFGVGVESLEKMRALSLPYFERGAEYILSVPLEKTPGYGFFLAVPFVVARKTWDLMNSNPEGVLKGDPKALKIDRQANHNILDFVSRAVTINNGVGFRSFMGKFVEKSEEFDFTSKRGYARICREYIGQAA